MSHRGRIKRSWAACVHEHCRPLDARSRYGDVLAERFGAISADEGLNRIAKFTAIVSILQHNVQSTLVQEYTSIDNAKIPPEVLTTKATELAIGETSEYCLCFPKLGGLNHRTTW